MKSLPAITTTFALISAVCLTSHCGSIAYAQQADASTATSSTALLDEQAFDDSFSKLPTNISADSLTLNAKQRAFAYKGNVTVEQGDMKLTSKTLEGTYGEDNQIQKLIAKGNVRITKQEIEATGQQALYDAASATMILSDNPQLKQGESLLTADRIKVFLKENRSQAEGAVRVTLVKGKDAGAPSFINLGKDEERPTRETTAASVVKGESESQDKEKEVEPKQEKPKTVDTQSTAKPTTPKSKPTTTKKSTSTSKKSLTNDKKTKKS
jgi:lipopolysaccharide export system protein LptA